MVVVRRSASRIRCDPSKSAGKMPQLPVHGRNCSRGVYSHQQQYVGGKSTCGNGRNGIHLVLSRCFLDNPALILGLGSSAHNVSWTIPSSSFRVIRVIRGSVFKSQRFLDNPALILGPSRQLP